jgi:hypothetical protein
VREYKLAYLPSASSFKGGSSPEEVIVKNKESISCGLRLEI